VRLNCDVCNEPHAASPQEQAWLDAMRAPGDAAVQPRRGRGCSACNGTGYSGRQGVYELLEMDLALAAAANQGNPAAFIATARERMQGRTLAFHALELVRLGRTSVAEAMRLGHDSDADADA